MKRIKICFVVADPTTAEVFLFNHFKHLSGDFDIYLVGDFRDDSLIFKNNKNIKKTNSIQIKRKISVLSDLNALIKLTIYFARMKFDIVHTITPKAGLLGILASAIIRVRFRVHVFTGQVWSTRSGIWKRILMLLDQITANLSTYVLVDSESQREFLVAHNIIKTNNSFVLGKGSISGVDINKFSVNQKFRENSRDELDLKNDVVFIFVGRINKDKGIIDLARAFYLIRKNFKKGKLLLVGPDEEGLIPEIMNICKDESSVIYYGYTNAPELAVQIGDIFCLPSYREGFGTSVIEASALKLPVICSDIYGLRESAVDGYTGLKFDVGSVDSLYEKMSILLVDSDLRHRLGENGSNYVFQNFTSERISHEWLEFYRRILNGN